MSVYVSFPLFEKPGEELVEGYRVTPARLLALAADLHHRLSDAAKVVELLGKHGWKNKMGLYSICLYPRKGVKTKAQAEAVLRKLGLNPSCFSIEEELLEEEDLSEPLTK